MDYYDSPRSSHRGKKKSSLAKVAASRSHRRIVSSEDSDDVDPQPRSSHYGRSSRDLDDENDLSGTYRKSARYPIDAQVEVRSSNQYRSYGRDDDSDEGIELNSSSRYKSSHGSDGTLSKLKSLNVDSLYQDSDEYGRARNLASSSYYKGEKRYRDQNSDGDDVARELGRSRNRKHLLRTASDSEDQDMLDRMPSQPRYGKTSPTRSQSDRSPSRLDRYSRMDVDRSEESDSNAKSDDEYQVHSRYKELLSNQYKSNNASSGSSKPFSRSLLDDEDEMEDNVPDMRKRVLTKNTMSVYPPRTASSPAPPHHKREMGSSYQSANSVSSNLYRSLGDRQWSMGTSVGQADELSSQRSFQSSSVLPLISTRQARNRSFLVGSVSGSGSLLGADELERYFPDRKMRIFVGTWNMCELKSVPESVDDFVLPDSVDYVQDCYIIGTQESTSNRREWEIKLQETLGPQHVLFHSAAHGVLYLSIFLRRDLAWFCSVPEEANISTRAGPSGMKTKGAVGVCFNFFGTSLLFINSHLSPHDGNIKERCADFHKICSHLLLPRQSSGNNSDDVTNRFDCVFWMGDLNFRIEKERERVDRKVRGIESDSMAHYEDLLQHDELFRARNEGLAFQDFQEGRIKFKPTYKYDIGTGNFDTSKKLRIPSYTDRVLFRCRRKHAVTCLHYNSAHNVCTSDHKPVYAMFEVSVRPGRDNIPLAAGHFNREVWLEANRRRSGHLEVGDPKPATSTSQKSSKVCTIQ